jgi:hypothetical protein
MIDDLRDQTDDVDFFNEDIETTGYEYAEMPEDSETTFLGMTARQRFVIAVMILLMTCLLSVFCLLATEKVAPSFLY